MQIPNPSSKWVMETWPIAFKDDDFGWMDQRQGPDEEAEGDTNDEDPNIGDNFEYLYLFVVA